MCRLWWSSMPDIRTGFVTQVDMELAEAFRVADETGCDHVEIMMEGDTDRAGLAERTGEIRGLADEHDVDILVHLPFNLDIGSPHEHVRDGATREVKAAIETAADIGAEKGVLHAASDAWMPGYGVEPVEARILDAVRTLDAHGADHDVAICVENVPNQFFDVRDFPYLFEQTDAAMTLDTGHARMSGMEQAEMASFIDEFADRIGHVHLNDTRQPEDEHLPFGAGDLDFDRLLAPLMDGWTGTLSLEVFTHDWDYIRYSTERLHTIIGR